MHQATSQLIFPPVFATACNHAMLSDTMHQATSQLSFPPVFAIACNQC
jgi:hypothetical protein